MTKHTCIAIAVASLLSACGGGSTASTIANSTEVAALTPTTKLGVPGKAGGIDFTLTDVATPNQLGMSGMGPKAEPGETFVVVSYTLKNTSGKPLPWTERPGLTLVDAKGQSYPADDVASTMAASLMDDSSGMTADLNPNVSAKTKSAWKVEKAAFDRGTWKLSVASDPALTFALK